MKHAMTYVIAGMLLTSLASVHADEPAKASNTSQSNRIATITSGIVNMTSYGGTGVSLGAWDAEGIFGIVDATHHVSPESALQIQFTPSLTTDLTGTLPYVEGIDPQSNITGQTTGAGIRTMYSQMDATYDPAQLQLAQVQASTSSNSIGLETDIVRDVYVGANDDDEVNKKVDKNTACRQRSKSESSLSMAEAENILTPRCRRWWWPWGISSDNHQVRFTAATNATLHLAESMDLNLDLDMTPEPGLLGAASGIHVAWSFGMGLVIGEGILLSDMVSYEISVDPDNMVSSLSLTDVTIYDLNLELLAGETYWFTVDTIAYSAFTVPEPGSGVLLLIPAVAVLIRRTRK